MKNICKMLIIILIFSIDLFAMQDLADQKEPAALSLEDRQLIALKNIANSQVSFGLRHVSTIDRLNRELAYGIKNGSSFSLGNSTVIEFTEEPIKTILSDFNGSTLQEQKNILIAYKAALYSFIRQSINMDTDSKFELGKTTYRQIIENYRSCSFMLIKFEYIKPRYNTKRFHGLGEIYKQTVVPQRIRAVDTNSAIDLLKSNLDLDSAIEQKTCEDKTKEYIDQVVDSILSMF